MRDPQVEAAAWELLERLRWDGPPDCPRCGASGRSYYLQPSGGVRRTRSGAPTARRLWKCGACRRQFTVLTGTVWEGTRIPVSTWLAAAQAYVRGLEATPTGTVTLPTTLAPAVMRRHMEQVLTAVTDRTAATAVGQDGS